jgi:hypothetical protein
MTFELAIKMVLPSIFSTTRKSRLEVAVYLLCAAILD